MGLVPTTELEAVNLMLATIGESPVSSLDQSGQVDAVIAQSVLNEIAVDVQSRGWHFNTDKAYKLKPEAFAPYEIKVPANAVQIDAVGADRALGLAIRGGKLWSRRDHSFSFEGRSHVLVDIVWLLTFAELPQAARRYVAIRAARVFQDRVVGSTTLHGFTQRDEQRAERMMRKFEAKTAKRSLLDASWSVARILHRNARG